MCGRGTVSIPPAATRVSTRAVPRAGQPFVQRDALGIGDREGLGEGGDAGDVVGAAATVPFLPATEQQGLERHPGPDPQHTDALRASELVAGEARAGSTSAVSSRRSIQQAACTASVWSTARGARSRTSAGDLGQGLDRADLVVDGHHRDDADLVVERVGQGVEIDAARGVDGDDAAARVLDGMEHGMVLGGRAHGEAGAAADRAEDGGIVGFGAAAGEHDLAGLGAQALGDPLARIVEGEAGRRARRDANRSGWRSVR